MDWFVTKQGPNAGGTRDQPVMVTRMYWIIAGIHAEFEKDREAELEANGGF